MDKESVIADDAEDKEKGGGDEGVEWDSEAEEFFECLNPQCDTPPPAAVTVGGIDCSGGAGIHADIRVMTKLGVHCVAVTTAVTAQSPTRVIGIMEVPRKPLEAQLKAVFTSFNIGGGKIGMVPSSDGLRTVLDRWPEEVPMVVDPVLVSTGGHSLAKEGVTDALKELLPGRPTLLTPNIPDGRILAGLGEDAPIHKVGTELVKIFRCPVLLKGGHGEDAAVVDVMWKGSSYRTFVRQRIEGEFRGTGCTLSSLIAALLSHGWGLEEAVEEAEDLIHEMIRWGYPIDSSVRVLDVNQGLWLGPESSEEARVLRKGLRKLVSILPPELVPEVGTNFGYSKPKPTTHFDVVALSGRIVGKEGIMVSGRLQWGGSLHIARVILGANSVDSHIRSACNLRYVPEVRKAVERLSQKNIMRWGEFDRAEEPEDSWSTMEWGTKEALKNGPVDAVWDTGDVGKEPMVRILGRDPLDVVKKVKAIIDTVGEIKEEARER